MSVLLLSLKNNQLIFFNINLYYTYNYHNCGLIIKVNHRFTKSITDSTKSTDFN